MPLRTWGFLASSTWQRWVFVDLDLDPFQVVIDDIVLPTPGGADTIMNEVDGVTHLVEEELKEPAPFETIGQNVPKGQTVLNGPFAPEGSSTLEAQPISDAPST